MTEVVYTVGAKGGAGATVCALKLSLALAAEGERTLLVDGDYECGEALALCGLSGLNVYTLDDAKRGACRVKQVILQCRLSPNLFILPTLGCNDERFVETAIEDCKGLFDKVVCDNVAQSLCTRALLVGEPYPSALPKAAKKASALKDGDFRDIGLIVNKVNGGLIFEDLIPAPQETAALIGLPLYGVIPEDLGLPLGKSGKATDRAFAMTATKLLGKSDKIFGATKPYTGIHGIIKRKLRKCV